MPGPIQAFLSPPSLVGAISRLATPIRFSERAVAMLAFDCVVQYCYTHTNASREKKIERTRRGQCEQKRDKCYSERRRVAATVQLYSSMSAILISLSLSPAREAENHGTHLQHINLESYGSRCRRDVKLGPLRAPCNNDCYYCYLPRAEGLDAHRLCALIYDAKGLIISSQRGPARSRLYVYLYIHLLWYIRRRFAPPPGENDDGGGDRDERLK
ncbi:unnamed protein product [Trichogramma brassicae]|uniref:Uncharacterized protein n=1 Tax=Trichogramma brassicae TaxID=86971 RepID=A0A6H5IRK1_9HYME|nr:unnamed protein product [Trichogramma brassicae]